MTTYTTLDHHDHSRTKNPTYMTDMLCTTSPLSVCVFVRLQNKPIVPHLFVFQNKSKEHHIFCCHQCSSSCGWPFPPLPRILTDLKRTTTLNNPQDKTRSLQPLQGLQTIQHPTSPLCANQKNNRPQVLQRNCAPPQPIPSVTAPQNHPRVANTPASSTSANVNSPTMTCIIKQDGTSSFAKTANNKVSPDQSIENASPAIKPFPTPLHKINLGRAPSGCFHA